MRRILLALVALPQWGGWLAQAHAALATQQGSTDNENPNIANKSLEFVNIIKDDLRRNNDDYVMPEQRSQVYPTPPELPAPPAIAAPLPPYRNLILPPVHQPALLMQPSFGQPEPLPKQPSQPVPLPMQPSQSEPLPMQPSQSEPLPKQPSQPVPLPTQPSQSEPLPMQPRKSEPLPLQPSQPGPLPMQPSQSKALPMQPSQPGPLPMQPSQSGSLPKQPSQPGPSPMQPSQPGPLFNQPGPLPNQPEQIRRHLEQLPHELNIEPRRSLNMAMTETSSAYNPFVFKSYTRSTRSTHSTHSTLSARYKHLRINKLKRLIDKKKHGTRMAQLFEMGGTTSSSPLTINPTPSAPPPPARPHAPPHPPLFNTKTTRSPSPTPTPAPHAAPSPARSPARTPARHPHFRPPGEQQQQPVMRQKPELGSSPSPDQLDMAPARGAKIRDIRFKGRLCQRNLMNMEGPSYDKAGNEVNPPHHPSNSRGRRFYQTRAPKLVLPRCCNCCKKSVLGCQ